MFFLYWSAAKSGVEPSGCVELAKHVSLNCPNLQFSGLMTIGMLDYTSTPENFKVIKPFTPKFNLSLSTIPLLRETYQVCWYLVFLPIGIYWLQLLAHCRTEVCKALEISEEQCELSMGMSADFEQAVRMFIIIMLLKRIPINLA